jgi:hypothetical protein
MIAEDRTALLNVGKVVMAGMAVMLALIAVSIVIV